MVFSSFDHPPSSKNPPKHKTPSFRFTENYGLTFHPLPPAILLDIHIYIFRGGGGEPVEDVGDVATNQSTTRRQLPVKSMSDCLWCEGEGGFWLKCTTLTENQDSITTRVAFFSRKLNSSFKCLISWFPVKK